MCGRVGFFDDVTWTRAVIKNFGDVTNKIGTFDPHYNIAPSQPLATLLNNGEYTYTHFGLIPHWMKEKKAVSINARAETLTEKPSFKNPYKRKRCLIPVNGFFEWKKEGKNKIPYWIHSTEGDFFALAGLWEQWHNKDTGEIITSSAIITTEPNEIMKPIHDRMPVILKEDDWKLWLDKEVKEVEVLNPLLKPFDSKFMEAYKVSTYVNSPIHDDIKAITPIKNSLF